jgi:hypothetical protein
MNLKKDAKSVFGVLRKTENQQIWKFLLFAEKCPSVHQMARMGLSLPIFEVIDSRSPQFPFLNVTSILESDCFRSRRVIAFRENSQEL